MLIELLLLACQSGGPSSVRVAEPSGMELESVPSAEASPWAPAESSLEVHLAALALVLPGGLPDPVQLDAAYDEVVTHGDDRCPIYEEAQEGDQSEVWSGGCTSAEGYVYEGLVTHTDMHEKEGDLTVFRGMGDLSSIRVTDAKGDTFTSGGEYFLDLYEVGGQQIWSALVGGSWSYPGAAGWLGQGVTAAVLVEGSGLRDQTAMRVDGGVTWPTVSLGFVEVEVDSEVCGGLPRGELSLRDGSGHWYSLPFPGCEPCAPAYWDGEEVGEACIGAEIGAALLAFGRAAQG